MTIDRILKGFAMTHLAFDELTDALVTGMPALDDESRSLVLALYRQLAAGQPVQIGRASCRERV